MKPSRFRPTRGLRAAASLLSAAGALLLAACSYGFSGGGGFPASIKTVCIQPFDNQTDHSELTNEIFSALNERVPRSLGLRPGDCKGGADAVIRGKITRYDDAATSYSANSGSTTTIAPGQQQVNQVQITIGVEIIDAKRNVMLWESSGVNGQGPYTNRNDAAGRKEAIDKLVQAVIDGAQSQW